MWHVRETITSSDGKVEHHLFGDFVTKDAAEDAASAAMWEEPMLKLDIMESDELVDFNGRGSDTLTFFSSIVAVAEKLSVGTVGIEISPRVTADFGVGGDWQSPLVVAFSRGEMRWELFTRNAAGGYEFKGEVR